MSRTSFFVAKTCGPLLTSAALKDCTIEDNTTGDIWLEGFTDSDFEMKKITLSDNVEYGLFVANSTLSLGATEIAALSISGSRYLVAGSDCSLTLTASP